MNKDDPHTPRALQALCQLAGEQAAWPNALALRTASPAASLRRRLAMLGLVGAGGLLTLAVVAAQFGGEPAPAAALAAAAAAAPWPAPQRPAPAPAAAAQGEPVGWQGGELVVDFEQVPLAQASAWLARATGTVVTGAHLLQQPVAVTLHARFEDVASAWKQLLHGHAEFAVTCGASPCELWVTRHLAAPAAPPQGAALALPPEAPAQASPEERASQPDGAC